MRSSNSREIRPSSPTTFGTSSREWALFILGALAGALVGRLTAKGDATPRPATPRGWPINQLQPRSAHYCVNSLDAEDGVGNHCGRTGDSCAITQPGRRDD